MKKQVGISTINVGESFTMTWFNNDTYTRVEPLYLEPSYKNNENRPKNCYFAINDRSKEFLILDKTYIVEIYIPVIQYKDIKVGEKFKIGKTTYLKVDNMMKNMLSEVSNPCVCLENSFLYNCENDISLERV